MDMLPPKFLVAQRRDAHRDALNFIHGFIANFSAVSVHFEQMAGVRDSKKVNYQNASRAILALTILEIDFRLEVFDPDKRINDPEHLYEKGSQHTDKGWRNYKFDPTDPAALARALGFVRQCIANTEV